MSAGSWILGRERVDSHDHDMSSFDVLGALPATTLDGEPSLIAPDPPPHTARSRSYHEPALGEGVTSGTGGSTESGLDQALERASYDSDEELEAIRESVRSLREQRAAVEKLKERARLDEGTAEELRRKLREAEDRIRELRAQGGRDVVRRLMDEVTELRARLKATSTAFQTRENSVAELREVVQALKLELRAGQEKLRAQSRKLEQQGRESLEQQVTFSRLEGACARFEERAQAAEKTAETKCAASGRELAALSALLKEANAALNASKGTMHATVAKQAGTLEAARKEKESLMFEKGRIQERLRELTALCEGQRSKLAESAQRARELERLASGAKKDTRLAQDQAEQLRAELSAVDKCRREEDAGATIKLRTAARQVEELRAELALVKSQAMEKERQLVRHRDEMSKLSALREDVDKLREAAMQQGDMRQAVRDRDETIRDLRHRLELERRERGQWGQARKQLLLEFCEEENKLRSTLQPMSSMSSMSSTRRDRRDRVGRPRQQQQQQQQRVLEHAPPTGSDRRLARDKPLSRHSTRHTNRNSRSIGDPNRSTNSPMGSLRGPSFVERREGEGPENEERGGDSGDREGEALLGLAQGNRVLVEGVGVGTDTIHDYDYDGNPRALSSDKLGMRTVQRLSHQA